MYDSTTIFALTHRVSHIALSREGGPSASGFDPAEPARSYRVGRLPFTAYRSRAARPARSAWPVQRRPAARFDGEVAGGADFFFVISSSGRDDGAQQNDPLGP